MMRLLFIFSCLCTSSHQRISLENFRQDTGIKVPYYYKFDSTSAVFLDRKHPRWGAEVFDRKSTRNLEIIKDDSNQYLRLTVYPGDFVAMSGCHLEKNCVTSSPDECCKCRDRAEVKFRPDHKIGKYYYAWRFFFPEDEFPDQPLNETGHCEQINKTRHFIAQWLQPSRSRTQYNYDTVIYEKGREFGIKGKPPIAIDFEHGSGKDGLYDLTLSYGTQYNFYWKRKYIDDKESLTANRQYVLKDVVAKNRWIEIVTEINWSPKKDEGYIRIWIDSEPLVFSDSSPKLLEKGGKEPSYIYGANLYTNTSNEAQPNYLKIGHYRSGMAESSSLYLDDFIISKKLEDIYFF